MVLGERRGKLKEKSPFKLVEMLKIQCNQSCVGESAHCYVSVVDKNVNVKKQNNHKPNPKTLMLPCCFSQEDVLTGGEA